MRDNYVRRFKLSRVIDGDTITTDLVDLGYHDAAYSGIRYRLLRIDCPETNRAASRIAGLAAKAFTVNWLAVHAAHDPAGWFYAQTQEDPETDSFGRYLANIECGEGHDLADALLISGNAVPYP